MRRRLFLASILPLIAISHALAHFDPDHEGHGRRKNHDVHDDNDPVPPSHKPESFRYFRPEDRVMLGRFYRAESLPPGLRKKYARTGTLPPGWQRRVQPLPRTLVERLPPPPPGCDTGYVDGYAVVYNRTTRVILDTVDLIGAITGR